MRELRLKPPSGQNVVEPTPDDLRQLLWGLPAKAWVGSSGSGDAGLWWEGAGADASLVFMPTLEGKPGFVVRYDSDAEDADYFLSVIESVRDRGVVYPGGNAWTLSSRHVVPPEAAFEASVYFCLQGTRWPPARDLTWIAGPDIDAE